MTKRTIILILVLSLCVTLLVSQAFSQNRRGRTRSSARWTAQPGMTMNQVQPPAEVADMMQQHQTRMFEQQQRMQQMRRQAEQNNRQMLKQVLQVTDEQWVQLEPQLNNIERLKHEASVSLDLSCFTPTTGLMGSSSFGGANTGGGFGGGSTGFTGGGGGMGGVGGGFSTGSTAFSSSSSTSTMSTGVSPDAPQQQSFSYMKVVQSGRPSSYKDPEELTDGDVLCEELLDLLQNPSTPAEEVARNVQALQQLRENAGRQLVDAKVQLRNMLNPRQVATLTLLGYLN